VAPVEKPAGHTVHVEAPELGAYTPVSHATHVATLVAPMAALEVPAAHLRHEARSGETYSPAPHCTHVEDPGAAARPDGHDAHVDTLVAPSAVLNIPAAQARQLDALASV
jgi:hypothetical protein